MTTADNEMPFLEHLRELRRRLFISVIALLVGFCLGLTFYHEYIGLITGLFSDAPEADLQMFQVQHGFVVKMKLSLYAGVIATAPIHLYNLIAFILPALNQKERRYLGGFVAASGGLVAMGVYIAAGYVIPLAVRFLTGSAFVPEGVDTSLNFSASIDFVVQMLTAFVVLFQLPLVLLILMAMDLLKRAWLVRYARYAIVLVFVVSALVTPPDIVSQIGLAVPLVLLYYLTILVAKVLHFGDSD